MREFKTVLVILLLFAVMKSYCAQKLCNQGGPLTVGSSAEAFNSKEAIAFYQELCKNLFDIEQVRKLVKGGIENKFLNIDLIKNLFALAVSKRCNCLGLNDEQKKILKNLARKIVGMLPISYYEKEQDVTYFDLLLEGPFYTFNEVLSTKSLVIANDSDARLDSPLSWLGACSLYGLMCFYKKNKALAQKMFNFVLDYENCRYFNMLAWFDAHFYLMKMCLFCNPNDKDAIQVHCKAILDAPNAEMFYKHGFTEAKYILEMSQKKKSPTPSFSIFD